MFILDKNKQKIENKFELGVIFNPLSSGLHILFCFLLAGKQYNIKLFICGNYNLCTAVSLLSKHILWIRMCI